MMISTANDDDVSNDSFDSGNASTRPKLPLSSNICSTVDPCVVLMKQLIQKHQSEYEMNHPDEPRIYSLAQGVVYWEPPTECQTAIIQSFTTTNTTAGTINISNVHMYSPDEGLLELRQMLQTKIVNENHLTNHDIIVTSGANQAYMNCVLTILSSSGKYDDDPSYAVIFAPYYFNHYMALQMTIGTENVLIGPLTKKENVPDIQWLQEQFILHNTGTDGTQAKQRRHIRMVTITNPCNPTGIAYTKEQIQPFVDLCRQYACYLILDATYEYFVHDNSTSNSSDTTAASNSFTACFNNEEHVIHIFSLSKSYAMAGYRIGYMVLPRSHSTKNKDTSHTATPSSSLYNNVLKVQDTIAIAPSHIGQIAAIGALQPNTAGQQWVHDKVQTLSIGRTAIYNALQVLQPSNIIGGTGAMYFMAQLPNTITANDDDNDEGASTASEQAAAVDDIEVAERLIQHYGIAIIPGTFCGAPGWIRVCYANLPPDQCVIAAQRLQQGLHRIFGAFQINNNGK